MKRDCPLLDYLNQFNCSLFEL